MTHTATSETKFAQAAPDETDLEDADQSYRLSVTELQHRRGRLTYVVRSFEFPPALTAVQLAHEAEACSNAVHEYQQSIAPRPQTLRDGKRFGQIMALARSRFSWRRALPAQ